MKENGLYETDSANVLHEFLEKIKGDKLKIFILAMLGLADVGSAVVFFVAS